MLVPLSVCLCLSLSLFFFLVCACLYFSLSLPLSLIFFLVCACPYFRQSLPLYLLFFSWSVLVSISLSLSLSLSLIFFLVCICLYFSLSLPLLSFRVVSLFFYKLSRKDTIRTLIVCESAPPHPTLPHSSPFYHLVLFVSFPASTNGWIPEVSGERGGETSGLAWYEPSFFTDLLGNL